MKLYIKQKVFSWNDKFYIKDESGNDKYYAESEFFTWGKKLHVYDMSGKEVAYIEQEILRWKPRYHVYINGVEVAEVVKEITFFKPYYTIHRLNWIVEGAVWLHEYTITENGRQIVSIEKEWFTWGDSYVLNISDPKDEVPALAVVLIIDCIVAAQSNN